MFVGDVQGCRDELERLLEACAFDPARDALHPVGDLVNRGPDSLGTLRLLRDLGAEGVLGNHDLHLLRTAHGTRELGRRDTLDEVLAAPDRDELLTWLAAWPFAREWDDLLLVHAALHPKWTDPVATLAGIDPLQPDERTDFATRTRYCDAAGNRPPTDWPPPVPPFTEWWRHWPADSSDTRTVVFGHWARQGLLVRDGFRGLDTGCVWGKQLTAWIAEEDRLVSVAAAREYSPMSTD
ncbi:MAG: metallophosphoesterase [Planctomycetes bacterium]|nr:metallophosphoesterase [Planctomycetota bacterium]